MTIRQLLSHLRTDGRLPLAAPSPKVTNPFASVERRFERYLVNERGVSRVTMETYLPIVHAFLAERFATQAVALETLTLRDVNRFIVRQSRRKSPSSAKLVVTALRSFLRHLHQRGDIPVDPYFRNLRQIRQTACARTSSAHRSKLFPASSAATMARLCRSGSMFSLTVPEHGF